MWQRLARPPALILSAAITATVGLIIAKYGPEALDAIEGGEPLRVTAAYDSDWYSEGWYMGTAEAVDPGSAPPPGSSCEDARLWAADIGGAYLSESWVKLVVEGTASSGVAIRSMRARILERSEPPTASMIACETAGDVGIIPIGFDLDERVPVARTLDDEHRLGEPYFANHVVTVAENEVVAFTVVGKTSQSYVRWAIELDIVIDGEEETLAVGEAEGGYRTTAVPNAFDECWLWDWTQEPARLVRGCDPYS